MRTLDPVRVDTEGRIVTGVAIMDEIMEAILLKWWGEAMG